MKHMTFRGLTLATATALLLTLAAPAALAFEVELEPAIEQTLELVLEPAEEVAPEQSEEPVLLQDEATADQAAAVQLLEVIETALNQYVTTEKASIPTLLLQAEAAIAAMDSFGVEASLRSLERATTHASFAKAYNEMMADARIHDSAVGNAVDARFDMIVSSRWMENGTDRYYTYGTQNDMAVPPVGIPYTNEGASTVNEQVKRLLAAGYPANLYGFTEAFASPYNVSNIMRANMTQEVLYKLLGDTKITLSDAYMVGLYEYATSTETLEPVGKATVELADKLELAYNATTEMYSAKVPLSTVGVVDGITVKTVPAGVTLLLNGKTPLKAGTLFDISETVTMVSDGKTPITGAFTVSYVSYRILGENVTSFASSNLMYTKPSNGHEELQPYTQLVGYQLEDVKQEASVSTIVLTGAPVPPAPVISTLNFAYATPAFTDVFAAPAGVQVPADQTQENASIKYTQPNPLHGTGDIPANYEFHGWYSDEACTKKVPASAVTESTTFYGYWTKTEPVVVPPTPPVTPDVTSYRLTVEYMDLAGNTLAASYSTRRDSGSYYDLTARTEKAIAGYAISRVDGSATGVVRNNLTITVYYAPTTDIPEIDVPTTDIPEVDVPTTDIPEVDVPTTDIPEIDVPTTDIPEVDVPTTDSPATAQPDNSDEVIIVDPAVPMGNLPQTGTTHQGQLYTAMALVAVTLAMTLGACAVLLVKGKKKS